jgi:hypothetical protein
LYNIIIMAQPFSNKVQNPLFNFSNAFGMANTTPMFSSKMQQQMQPQALVPVPTAQKKATAQSTTPTAQTDPTSLGAYKGVPIKYGDQNSIQAQMAAIDANQPGAKPTTGLASGGGIIPTAQAATGVPTPAAAPAATAIGQNPSAVRGIMTPPKGKTQEAPTFSGILYDLIRKATEGDEGVRKSREDLTKFQGATADKIAAIRSTPIALEFQQGRAQAVQQASAEKEKALQTGVENALTAQGQSLNALNQAAGLAAPQQLGSGNVYIDPATGQPIAGGPTQVSPGNVVINPLTGQPMGGAPTQVPFTNQLLDPLTGQPVGGAGAGGVGGKGLDVDSVAQQILSGQMSPSQGYDIFGNNLAFNNALNQAVLKQNPQFNFIQAEANAAAQGQALAQATERGGDLQKRGDTVLNHIGQLQTAYEALQGTTPSPYLNMGINLLKGAYPSKEFQAYLTALDNVRGELAGIFAVGGTPTEGENMAKRILPDGATPAQIAGALEQAKTLIAEKIHSYSTPSPSSYGGGAVGGGAQSGAGSGGMWDW